MSRNGGQIRWLAPCGRSSTRMTRSPSPIPRDARAPSGLLVDAGPPRRAGRRAQSAGNYVEAEKSRETADFCRITLYTGRGCTKTPSSPSSTASSRPMVSLPAPLARRADSPHARTLRPYLTASLVCYCHYCLEAAPRQTLRRKDAQRQEIRVKACTGAAIDIRAGQTLTVVDLCGGQVGDFFAQAAENPGKFLSPGVTIDCNESLVLRVGDTIYTNLYRPMFLLLWDDAGQNDLIHPSCRKEMFDFFYHNGEGASQLPGQPQRRAGDELPSLAAGEPVHEHAHPFWRLHPRRGA